MVFNTPFIPLLSFSAIFCSLVPFHSLFSVYLLFIPPHPPIASSLCVWHGHRQRSPDESHINASASSVDRVTSSETMPNRPPNPIKHRISACAAVPFLCPHLMPSFSPPFRLYSRNPLFLSPFSISHVFMLWVSHDFARLECNYIFIIQTAQAFVSYENILQSGIIFIHKQRQRVALFFI